MKRQRIGKVASGTAGCKKNQEGTPIINKI